MSNECTTKSNEVKTEDVPVCEMKSPEKNEKSFCGCMKGTVHFIGDVISPIDEEWDANR